MSIEHLSRVEASYGFDRTVVQTILEKARDDQARLEELAAKHSCELPAWTELAGTLDERRTLVLDAVDRVIAETMELNDAVFGGISREECVEILRGLGQEFAGALKTRAECARLLEKIAGAHREEGYSGSEVIDNALKRAVSHLRDCARVPEDIAVEYVGQLAEFLGLSLSPAGGAHDRRFPDLTEIFKDETGTGCDDVANRVQQTALGLWPADPD